MKDWLIVLSERAIVVIDAMALVVVVFGAIQTFVSVVAMAFRPADVEWRAKVWLRFGRWLVAGLTFRLAADIIETSISTSWEAIGRIAAIAVIRTFLNYFLEGDLKEVGERRRDAAPTG